MRRNVVAFIQLFINLRSARFRLASLLVLFIQTQIFDDITQVRESTPENIDIKRPFDVQGWWQYASKELEVNGDITGFEFS